MIPHSCPECGGIWLYRGLEWAGGWGPIVLTDPPYWPSHPTGPVRAYGCVYCRHEWPVGEEPWETGPGFCGRLSGGWARDESKVEVAR